MAVDIKASPNPESVSQEAHHQAVKDVEKTAGTPVHTFDDSMTPEQKREQVERQVPAEMLPPKPNDQQPGAMLTDQKTHNADAIALAAAEAEKKEPAIRTTTFSPEHTPRLGGTDPNDQTEAQREAAKPLPMAPVVDGKSAPGAFTNVPNWYRSGWTAFSSLENPGGTTHLTAAEKPVDPLGDQLSESLYGEWWWNSGVLFFTGFFSWLLVKIGLGFFSVMIVCAFLGNVSLHTV